MTREQLEIEMSHPVRVLRFVTGIYEDVEDVRGSIHMSSVSEGTLLCLLYSLSIQTALLGIAVPSETSITTCTCVFGVS